jgi:hypothetical protein
MYRIMCGLSLAAVLLAVTAARASGPIGGYLIVDKVVLTPTDAPTTVQVWGSFILSTEVGGKTFGKPERGYLYYEAPKGAEVLCRREWKDLASVAGTGQVIGFGSSQEPERLGKVRKADRKPESPDAFPLSNGLVRIPSESRIGPVRALLALPAPRTPAEGDLVPPGAVTLVTRNILDKTHPGAKYVFELKGAAGDAETASVEAGEKETRWTPRLRLKAGQKYTWTVRAAEGEWKGPPVTSGFVVKGGK